MASKTDSIDRERLVATMLELIAIDSPTGFEKEIGDHLEARFGELGCEVSRDETGNLVCRYAGNAPGTILFSTHMDTAGTDTGIKPIIGDDGVIRTDGSTILGADDKSGLAGVIEVLTLLGENPDWRHPEVEVVVSVSEEQGLKGSRALDVSQLKATHGFVLDTAGALGAITYWSPTTVYLTVAVHGRKAHAGVEPEKGINAIRVAAEAVAAMPLGRIDEETVANIGTIEGGEARNVVPGECRMVGMVRSHDQEKLDAQVEAMRQAFESAAGRHGATLEFEAEEIYRTYKIPFDAPPYRDAARAIESVGVEVVARKSGGGTDGNVFNARGIQCVGLATGMADEHATSEHIRIDDLVTAASIWLAIVTQEPA
jgi:tripeptide aminopeptidase